MRWQNSLSFVSFGLLALAANGVQASQTDYLWNLTAVRDDDGQAGVNAANAKDKNWRFEVTYARGSASGSFRIKRTYLGPTDKSFKIPHVKGAYTVTDCTWTSPMAKIAAGKEFALKVTGAASVRTHQWPDPYVGLIAQIVSKNVKGEYVSQVKSFKNKKRQDMMMVGSGTAFKPFDEAVSAAFPKGGKAGETLGVKVQVSNGNARASVVYVYTWGSASETTPTIKDY